MALHKLTESVQDELIESILNDEYGDIRSILDEMLPYPTWDEQVEMTTYLTVHVQGAVFEYTNGTIMWTYVEEGE